MNQDKLDVDLIAEAKEYWKNIVSDGLERISLANQYKKDEKNFNKYSFRIDEELFCKLKKITKNNDISIYTFLVTVLEIELFRYTSRNDLLIGIPVYLKSNKTETVNKIMPFKSAIDENNTFKEQLVCIKNSLEEIYRYQVCYIEKMISGKNIDDANIGYAINVAMKNVHNIMDIDYMLSLQNNEINFVIDKSDSYIDIELFYNVNLLSDDFISKFVTFYIKIFSEVILNLQITINDIDIIGEEEKRKILIDFNDTKTEYPKDKTIYQLFEEQVEKTPDNIALVYENKTLTYRELNEKSNSLARVLREKGVRADSIVGIVVEKSLEMMIGIIGILKAGGAYLPIDSEYPQDRIEYMLEDSSTKILVTKNHLIKNIRFDGIVVDLENRELYEGNRNNLEYASCSSNLAYVIYTSGSTGKPKGIMVEHKGVVNHLYWSIEIFLQGENLDFPLFTSVAFDLTVPSIYTPLITGNKIIIYEWKDSKSSIQKIIEEDRVGVVKMTPSHFRLMKDVNKDNIKIKRFVVAGEEFEVKLSQEMSNILGTDIQIYNEYGPTEASVGSTIYKVGGEKLKTKTVPIGKPINNTRIYILDKSNKLLPIGMKGELCISGDGVARGYLNRPELTAEKFVLNPYELGKRMYKTGDMARWLPDGNIEYLGRIDNQVKIRGFRVELGEIEKQLIKNEEIKEAVVVDKEDNHGNKYLCAYIVCKRELTTTELREHLLKVLPDYMIPSYFMQMEKMPLTQNGKVDRKGLPEPDGHINTGIEYEVPRNEVEEKLVKIWEEVLGIEKVGISDDFFSLGGDSIKAIQVISRLKESGYSLEVKDLLTKPNIKGVINYIKKNSIDIYQGEIIGKVKLTPIQRWFFEEKTLNKNHFNQAVMIFNKDGFQEELIEKSFNEIIKHHDILRTYYNSEEGIIKDIDEKAYDLYVYDLREKDVEDKHISDLASSIQSSIELRSGPLVKLGLFKTKEGDHLLIAIHHMIIDGVSWRILFEDFSIAYSSVMNKQKLEFPLKTTSFKEWSEKQVEYTDRYKLSEEIEYWNKINNTEIKSLPRDSVIKDLSRHKLRVKTVLLNESYTNKLLKEVNKAYSTEVNDILLSALAATIGEFANADNILINLESHGREEIVDGVDITRTIGWFTTRYPVILDACKDGLSSLIKNTKDILRRIPNKGIGYGILKYLYQKNTIRNKLNPEITFNYLGQFDEDINGRGFQVSRIYPGESISLDSNRLYLLDISGLIKDKKLNISIAYSSEEYLDSTIENLLNMYKNNIIEIIKYCAQKQETEMTLSDFDYKDLSIEEFEYIKSAINIQLD